VSENLSEQQQLRIAAAQAGMQPPSSEFGIEEIQYFHPQHQSAVPLPDAMIKTALNPEQAFTKLKKRDEFYLKLSTRQQEIRARISIPAYSLTDDQDAELNAMEPIQFVKTARSEDGFNIKQFTEQRFRGEVISPDAMKNRGFRAFGRWRGAKAE